VDRLEAEAVELALGEEQEIAGMLDPGLDHQLTVQPRHRELCQERGEAGPSPHDRAEAVVLIVVLIHILIDSVTVAGVLADVGEGPDPGVVEGLKT